MFVSLDTVKAGYRVFLAAAATACMGGGFYVATRYFGPEKNTLPSTIQQLEKKPAGSVPELQPQSKGS